MLKNQLQGGETKTESENMTKSKSQEIQFGLIIGFLIAIFGVYLIFVAYNIAIVIPQLREFLIKYQFLNNGIMLAIFGIILTYIGYLIYRRK